MASPTLAVVLLETRAVLALLNTPHPAGFRLHPLLRDALRSAHPSPVLVNFMEVRCGETETLALLDYVATAAVKFRAAGRRREQALFENAFAGVRRALTRLKQPQPRGV